MSRVADDIHAMDDETLMREAIGRLAQKMTHPKTHEMIKARAGVHIDKLSEVVMSQMVDVDDADLRLSDLANRLGVELSSVSRKVHKLEEAGMVIKVSDPADARAWHLRLTPAGQQAMERLTECRRQLMTEVLATWPEDDRHSLAVLFDRFTKDLLTQLGEQQ